MRGTRRKTFHVLAALLAVAVLAGCQPDRPSVGRGTPVRRVLLIGDSITHGLFGTSPKVHGYLNDRMRQRGIALSIGGFAGENPLGVWDGHPRWVDVLRQRVATENPDMIIIQSMLFPDAGNTQKQAQYLAAMREILDVAQSRGAHVYLVKHAPPPRLKEQLELTVVERLQGQAGARRGISWIPLNAWIANCNRPTIADGWHLSGSGQNCHAGAVAAAVDQLRDANRR
jgi:lysophospholipase L1-like esterase